MHALPRGALQVWKRKVEVVKLVENEKHVHVLGWLRQVTQNDATPSQQRPVFSRRNHEPACARANSGKNDSC